MGGGQGKKNSPLEEGGGENPEIRNLLEKIKDLIKNLVDELNEESSSRAFDPVFSGFLTPQINKVGEQNSFHQFFGTLY